MTTRAQIERAELGRGSELRPCDDVIRHGRDGDVYAEELRLAELKGLQWTSVYRRSPGVCVLEYGSALKPVIIFGYSDEPPHLARSDALWSGQDNP